MKKLFILVSATLFGGNIIAQSWTWDRTPEAGQNVNIQIKDVPNEPRPLHAVAYFFDGTDLISNDVGLLPSDKSDQINMALVLHDHVSWIKVVLKDEFNEILSGDQQFVNNPKALPKAGLVEQTLASAIYGRLLDMKVSETAAVASLNEAFTAYPQWKDNPEVFRTYYLMSKKANSTEDLNKIRAYLTDLSQKSNGAGELLMVQAVKASKDMGDSTLTLALRKKLDKQYPKSLLTQEELLTSFTKSEASDEQIKIRDLFTSRFPVTKDNKRMMDQMTSTLVQHFAEQEDWTKAKLYIDKIMDPMVKASVCNRYAWTLSGESIEAEAPYLDEAADLSSTSLSLVSADNPPPTGMTKKEWAVQTAYFQAMYGDTYALILYKQGKYDEALDKQSFAVRINKFEDPDMNERYAVYLQKAGHTKEFEQFMDQIMVIGKASPKVKAMHKEYWTSTTTKDQLYNQYVAQLEQRAKELREQKIKKMWEETPAAPFTLKDLSGKVVSLSDYKGKTIVLDFWATWCGPCKASFPGMKKAIEHFASDQSVVFLFVDTWEGGDNVQGKVTDFISTNNYPFHVVMDLENKVVSDYKVSGIPTKFIIGPDQKIRFTAIGYGGNNDELVEELKTMIQLVQEYSGMQKS
jgi:thiol-disulfide isomerase/thioredoxin